MTATTHTFPFLAALLAMANIAKASGAQLASFLPLREFTERSARIAQLKLSIYYPWEDTYNYTGENKPRQVIVFKCLLVDPTDPTCYCHAEY